MKEDQLGSAIAAAGGTVVVGEPLDTVGANVRAYVFTEGAGGWATATQTAKLVASNGEAEEAFGASVAISGNTIVVGAPGRKSGSGVDAGGAYVYSEPPGGWGTKPEQTETAELYNSEDVALYSFGTSVAISGETIVVGAPFFRDYGQNLSPPADGAAFVFLEPAGGWANEAHHPEYQTATLVPHESEVENDGHFGQSVSIGTEGSEQTVVVGAPVEPVGTEPDKYQRGIVFLFSRPAGGWTTPGARFPEARLTASDATEFANLGESVAISGNTIAAGAPRAEVASVRQGATYVFTAPAGGWVSEPEQTQVAKLTSPGGVEGDQFGESVALEGDTVVVGGALKNASLFAMPSSGWSGEIHQTAEFEGKVYAVGLSGGDALMGLGEARPPGGAGEAEQGAVDVVPFAPSASTGTAQAQEQLATVVGTVNPNQTTLSSCQFQYGTSSSYGQEIPCSSFPTTGVTSSPVSAELPGLTPGTTYHYRILATNEVDTSYGEDKTFTTAAAPGKGPEPTTPITTTTPVTTTPTTSTTKSTTPPPALTVGPQPSPSLACTTAQVALINVVQQGSRVEITGAARLVLAGKRVEIKFLATHKTVASATIAANGTFSASAPLPPGKVRETNLARYEAIVGSLHSLNLKLDRRMYMVNAKHTGTHVLLSGYVTGSFKAGAVVKILLRVTCSKEEVIAKVKLTGSGKFSATVAAPTGAASQIAVYRATTTVLKDGHPETTFTLPTPPTG